MNELPEMSAASPAFRPDPTPVLAHYPTARRQGPLRFLGGAGGFSGALFWRIDTPGGPLGLRRWPQEHPSAERLGFVHGVLRHIVRQGFGLVPAPLATQSGATFVEHAGHLWELTPWLPGQPLRGPHPPPASVAAALGALAQFHRAAGSLPGLPSTPARAPGIAFRLERLDGWPPERLDTLARTAARGDWPQLAERVARVLPLVRRVRPLVERSLKSALELRVPLGPAIRDIWSDHVLFDGDRVSGLIDFGALAIDSFATDIARLTGSLVGDDQPGRERALAAYEQVRPLLAGERLLVRAFDVSAVLLSPLNWFAWHYFEHRTFADRERIVARVDEQLARLEWLSSQGSP